MLSAEFGLDPNEDTVERERLRFEPERNQMVVTADGDIVGNAGVYSAQLTVPGAALPAALVTAVSVAAPHRRRGLLTHLMTRLLADARARAEPLAVLWASEGRIYQRFGYGLATRNAPMSIESREVSLRAGARGQGRLRTCPPAVVRSELEQVYKRVSIDRPGWFSRGERWWSSLIVDPKSARCGATARRATLYERDGAVEGYVIWRMKPGFTAAGPAGEVLVVELVAATTEATVELWRHLLTMDLTRTVRTEYGAIDDPLGHLVDEPRRLGMRAMDGLWLRIIDLPSALTGRRYAAPVEAVFDVRDALLPENAGRWRLRVGADGAGSCERSPGADPDLACDIADLGAVYLGGVPLGRLVDAGRVRQLRSGAVREVGAAFGWHRDPAPMEMF